MVVQSLVSTEKSSNPVDSAALDAGVVSIDDNPGMNCKGVDNRNSDRSPSVRRTSARIKKLETEKALRVGKREELLNHEEDRVVLKRTRVYSRRKVDTPNVGSDVAEIGGSKVQTEVLGSNEAKDCAVMENRGKTNIGLKEVTEDGAGSDKSACAMVTETLRIFNKHYLHFVQFGYFYHCSSVKLAETMLEGSLLKQDMIGQEMDAYEKFQENELMIEKLLQRGETAEGVAKRDSRRPDLKAITKASRSLMG
ncbi:unnamed protein product [Ilex paraguariensis]|uniref:Uncharacterized protein n=1 Tax=Ilex paraguariensis TaxID=185542 RepID=A0ABC8URI3_9AQUA